MGKQKQFDDAADEKIVAEREKRNELAHEQELEDIRTILDQPAGIRFMRNFFDRGRMFQSSFTGNSQTFFLEGHRNFALIMFDLVSEAAPGKVAEVIVRDKPQKEREKKND